MNSNNNSIALGAGGLLTLKAMLVPLLTRPRVAQAIKYIVYFSLTVNFVFYMIDDYEALLSALPDDAPLMDVLTRFSTTVDMAAWLGLIVLFELETYALSDEAFTWWVTLLLRVGRAICYVSIVSAAYGYTVEALQTYDFTQVREVSNTCELADQGLWLQVNSVDYEEITDASCAGLPQDQLFYQFEGETSVIGASLLKHVQLMGLIDISNAFIWIFVVLLIEVEVWLQSADRFASRLLTLTRQTKTLFYLVLIGNGIIWGVHGYALYAWDAFLWIFGFWAIELNLAEWEIERLDELRADREINPA